MPLTCRPRRTLAASGAALIALLAVVFHLTAPSANTVAYTTISGRVSDSNGSPLADVYVSAFNLQTAATAGDSTDASGNYQLYIGQPGNYRLGASPSNNDHVPTFWTSSGGVMDYLQAEPIQVLEPLGQALTGYDIAMLSTSTISGRVTDNSGIPLSDIGISPHPLDGLCLQCVPDATDANGEYTITVEPGAYWLFISGGTYRAEWWNSSGGDTAYQEQVVVGPGENIQVSDVQLSSYGAITGTIRDPEGIPLPEITVTATPSGCCPLDFLSDENGQYTAVLSPGAYVLGATGVGYQTAYWASAGSVPSAEAAEPVTTGWDTVVAGVDITLNPKGSISGRLTDSSGTPVPFAGVVASRNNFDCCEFWYAPTDDSGAYKIVDLETGDYELLGSGPPEYALVYYTASGGSPDANEADSVQVLYGFDTPVAEFHLLRHGSISGRITDMLGAPVVGAEVSAWLTGCSGCAPSTWSDADGNYRFDALAPGDYLVGAIAAGYMRQYWSSQGSVGRWDDAEPVHPQLEQDIIGIDLHLPHPASIEGRVLDSAGNPIQSATVSLSIIGCPGCTSGSYTDSNGQYSFPSIPPGEITLYAYKSGLYTSMYWTSDGGDPWQPELIQVNDGAQLTGYDFTLVLPGFHRRDVDCEGDVDSVDALKILRAVAGVSVIQSPGCAPIGTGNPLQGDVDCDGNVDAADALGILRYVAGLANLPPTCPAIGP